MMQLARAFLGWIPVVMLGVAPLAAQGGELFGEYVAYDVGDGPYSVTIARLDGDEYYDIAVANGSSDFISILFNQGDGTFGSPVSIVTGFPYDIASGDLDRDGDQDLVVTNAAGNYVSILFNNGDGTFAEQVDYPAHNAVDVTLGHLNNDSALDLVLSHYSDVAISVMLNNGDGSFAPKVTYADWYMPLETAIDDFNGDGAMDVAVSHLYTGLTIHFNDGTGGLIPADTLFGFGAVGLASGDLDHDGDKDLVVSSLGENLVYVLLNSGNGTFPAFVRYPTGPVPVPVAIADFNGDQHLDVAVGEGQGGYVSILPNRGDGTFDTRDFYYVGGSANNELACGDLDGDGYADLAVPLSDKNQVSVLLNQTRLTSVEPGRPAVSVATRFAVRPNPARGSGFVSLDMPQEGFVSVRVFDVTGRLVERVFENRLDAGLHDVPLDLTGLRSGRYFCDLRTGSEHSVRSLTLVR